MIKNIKQLYNAMDFKRKNEAVRFIMKEYNLTSEVATKRNYISKGEISEDKQPVILKKFTSILEEQIKELNKIIK